MQFFRMRYGLKNVHPTCYIFKPRYISPDLVAGEFSSIGYEAWIGPKVVMGKYVLIAPELVIIGDDHRFDLPGLPIIFSGRPDLSTTFIEDDVWIGQRVLIRSGVRIGRGAIIGMGSVVTKDIQPYGIYAGNPAKLIRMRFSEYDRISTHDVMLRKAAQRGQYCEGW